MRYILNESTNPYYNLALDEYAMKHIDEDDDFFILWQNEPSVIIGKNQNTLQEISPQFIEENGIHVARRVSGGGAVYHDFGNLNFTFITKVDDMSKVNFTKYVQPIVDALEELGIQAKASGRNDIHIGDKKISGNAQRQANGRLMHHGTLIFDVNIEDMVSALNVADEKFISKAAKSVRSRVTNIKEHLPEGTTLETFWSSLHRILSRNEKDAEIILTEEQKKEIQREADTRFSTKEWIYGVSPEFTYTNRKRFDGGTLEAFVDVQNGRINTIRFIGDYLGINDIYDIEEALKGEWFTIEAVSAVLDQFELQKYLGLISKEEVMEVLFSK